MAFENGMAKKGSQLWIQLYANNKYLFNELNNNPYTKEFGDPQFIVDAKADNLTWISPIKHDYDEYMLSQDEFWNNKKVKDIKLPFTQGEIKDFWVSRQPIWDGIAINETEHTLYLIEAKAHVEEITQDDKIIPIRNQKIMKDIIDTKENTFEQSIKYKKWINIKCKHINERFNCDKCEKDSKDKCKVCHYQIINRLWMFDVIRYLIKKNNSEWKVKLVFIDFINDHTSDKNNNITYRGFKKEYKGIYHDLDKNLEKIDGVSLIYFCVDKISSAYKTIISQATKDLNKKLTETKFW